MLIVAKNVYGIRCGTIVVHRHNAATTRPPITVAALRENATKSVGSDSTSIYIKYYIVLIITRMQRGTLDLAARASLLRAFGANENTSREWERCLN